MKTHLEIAIMAAKEAGNIILSKLGKSIVSQKGATNNLVTDADTASEQLIANLIQSHFPQSSILGEEVHLVDNLLLPSLWVIDPLDGTNNYAHGIPQFSISIAYAEYGEVLCGVVYDPLKGELFCAEKGSGSQLNGKPIAVSKNKNLSDCIIATGFPYERGELIDNTLRAIHHLFKSKIQCIRRMGSAALDLSWVACGRFDAYFEYFLSPWDFAAGSLILKEAGGIWGDKEGIDNGLNSKGIICSNGLLYEQLLHIIKYSVVASENNRAGL